MTNHSYFRRDERLSILLPAFPQPFEEMAPMEQENIIAAWEAIRARIPDKIYEFEQTIQSHLDTISETEDWDRILGCFEEISDMASRIAELNTWKRVDPSVTVQQQ